MLPRLLPCMLPGVPNARKPRNLERERARAVLKRCGVETDLGRLAKAIQLSLGYVPPHALPLLAEKVGLEAEAVASRLGSEGGIRLAPDCRQRIEICSGRTCARRGGAKLIRLARSTLGIDLFRETPDRRLRIEPFRCFGQCARAPNLRINGVVQGAMTEKRFGLLLGVLGRGSS